MFSIVGRRRGEGEGGGLPPALQPPPPHPINGLLWRCVNWKGLVGTAPGVWLCGRYCLALLGDNEHGDTSRPANVPGCVGGQEGSGVVIITVIARSHL